MIFLAFAESIQLVPDGTLFLHIIIVLIMVFVLNRTLFKPINRILEEREKRTHGRSSEAQELSRKVDDMLRRYENTLRQERAEGYRLMEQVRAEAIQQRQEKLKGVREEINQLMMAEKSEINKQADATRATLERDARSIAADISAQILHRPLSERTISETGAGV